MYGNCKGRNNIDSSGGMRFTSIGHTANMDSETSGARSVVEVLTIELRHSAVVMSLELIIRFP